MTERGRNNYRLQRCAHLIASVPSMTGRSVGRLSLDFRPRAPAARPGRQRDVCPQGQCDDAYRPGHSLTMMTPQRSSRVLLVASGRSGADVAGTPLRRYRLARLRLDARTAAGPTGLQRPKRA